MGIISSLIDVAGGVIDNFAEDQRQRINRDWQTEERLAMQDYQTSERESQNEWNLEQWNRENEYNSPIAQLNRVRQAGLNPNMMFGGAGDVATASALQGSSGSAPSAPSPASYPLKSQFGNTVSHALQNLLTEEEVKLRQKQNGLYEELTQAEINQLKSEAYDHYYRGQLTAQEFRLQTSIFDNLVTKSKLDIQIAEETVNQILAQTDVLKSQKDLIDKESDTEDARKTNIESDTRLKEQEAIKLEWENLFREQFGIDPNSGSVQMLIQGLLSGDDKASNFINQLFGTIRGVFGIKEEPQVTGQPGSWTGKSKSGRKPVDPRVSLSREYAMLMRVPYSKRDSDWYRRMAELDERSFDLRHGTRNRPR